MQGDWFTKVGTNKEEGRSSRCRFGGKLEGKGHDWRWASGYSDDDRKEEESPLPPAQPGFRALWVVEVPFLLQALLLCSWIQNRQSLRSHTTVHTSHIIRERDGVKDNSFPSYNSDPELSTLMRHPPCFSRQAEERAIEAMLPSLMRRIYMRVCLAAACRTMSTRYARLRLGPGGFSRRLGPGLWLAMAEGGGRERGMVGDFAGSGLPALRSLLREVFGLPPLLPGNLRGTTGRGGAVRGGAR